MRVSSKVLYNTVMGNMQRNSEKLLDLQNSVSSGKKLNKPSDDPAGAARVINYNSAIAKAGQYQRNIDNAAAFLNATETAVSATQDVLLRAKELALSALNGTYSAADRRTMAMEVDQLYEQVKQTANTTYDNRYIFAGFRTDVAPYDDAGNYTGTSSDDGFMDVEIDAGNTMSINIPGYAVFGSSGDGTDILAAMGDLKTAMNDNDTAAIGAAMTKLDTGMDQINDRRAEIGVKLSRLELAKNHIDTLQYNLLKYRSDTEDADITSLISQLALQQNMLEISRATAARVLQQSIMDFLR